MYSKVKSTLESIKTWAMEHKVGCVTATQPHRPCTREMTPEEREEPTDVPQHPVRCSMQAVQAIGGRR